ncbi:MAG: DUF4837 family protein [Bacteroidales bacterium]
MKKSIMYVCSLFILFSCNPNGFFGGSNLGGKAGELLIVINNEYTNTKVAADIRSVLNQYEVGLVQSEPPFNILTISKNHFSSVFRPHRNILFIDVNSKYTKPSVTFHKDMWTKGQYYVGVGVNSADSLVPVIEKHHSSILDYFIKAEITRYQKAYKNIANKQAQRAIAKELQIRMDIPKGFEINKQVENFAWLSLESEEHSQGIIIYKRPYTDTLQLEKKSILHYRDSILKKHIPGPTEGSYMTTEYILPIQYKVGRYIEDSYTVELRGKWRVENDFMAGPFISYTFVDTAHHDIFTIDGYVYYPNKNKRNYMRQVEAICRSTHILIDTSSKTKKHDND